MGGGRVGGMSKCGWGKEGMRGRMGVVVVGEELGGDDEGVGGGVIEGGVGSWVIMKIGRGRMGVMGV